MEQVSTKSFIRKTKSIFRFLKSFQRVDRLFVLSLENEDDRKVHTGYYLPKVEIKDYTVMIEKKPFLISHIKLT